MSDDTTSPSSSGPSAPQGSFKGVPAAIVIAGGLIALAIYFAGGRGAVAPVANTGDQAGGVVVDDAEVAGEEVAVGDIRPVGADDHIRGSQNAKVTIVEYSDIECPFCKRFHPTMQQLMSEYPNDVRWVYRHFPLEQLHPNARVAAYASECAAEQGKFWEALDYMFENTETGAELAKENLPTLAQAAGVPNIAAFQTCLDSEKYKQRIEDDLADAAVAGGQGTPHSIIIGPDGTKQPFSGAQPYESLKAAVDALL